MFKKIRVLLAAVFFVCITLLFLDFTGTLHAWLGWMAKIQFLPAMLAANTAVIAVLILVTVLFGRIYCSTICPLGVMQDMISWIPGKIKKKNRLRFRYTPERKWLRYSFLVVFIIMLCLGIHSLAVLIAPYSAYGRIASNILAPLYQLGNNALAWIAERAESYAFYEKKVWIRSIPTFITAVATFVILFIMAWKGGRTYCNTVCPVGTILGFFARRSIFSPVIDKSLCNSCGLCEKQCRASCIDSSGHSIDYSRCVSCMDCIETCNHGAISLGSRYSQKDKGTDTGRRAFLTALAITGTATACKAHGKQAHDGGTPLVPAGAVSLKNMADRCTACQLCISACPNNVLRPSSSLTTLMQPEMSYDKGFCRPECNKCSDVCPTGAIRPVTVEEKSSIQIGHAVVDLDLCVVNTDDVSCGNCARHCPAQAIMMVSSPSDNSRKVPAVDESRCIGCGACEYLCPARPVSAIHIEGHHVHKMI